MKIQDKILIFDMDGVILDSEPLHQNAREIMYKKYGICPDDSFPDPVGKSSSGFWEMVGKKYGFVWDADKMEEEQYLLVAEQVKNNQVEPSAGLKEVLIWSKKNHIHIGLASSSTRMLVDKILELLDIREYFDVVVSGDEVEHKKPAPDVYEKVLKIAGFTPDNAMAVEDSSTGIEAAKAAGIYCFGYKNQTSGSQNLSKSDSVVMELKKIMENRKLCWKN